MDSHDVTLSFVENTDVSPGDGRHTVIAWCLIFDVLLAWCSWTELSYRNAVEVTAKFTVVGTLEHDSRNGGHRVWHRLRYEFRHPNTGRLCQNTVAIPTECVPAGQSVLVQYIPGEMLTSRLALQARPVILTVFMVINSVFVLAFCGVIVCLAREANHKPLTRQQRWMQERNRIKTPLRKPV